jgi:hypothetical protein
MKRPAPAWLTLAACGAAIGLVVVGCGSSDCTETATCQGAGGSPEAAFEAGGESGGDDVTQAQDGAMDGPSVEDSGNDSLDSDATQDAPMLDAPSDGHTMGPDAPPDVTTDSPPPPDTGAGCNANAPDCSNAQCQANFECTPVAPGGWFGPVALFDQGGGPPAPMATACTGDYGNDAFDGHATPSSPSLTCACTCGSPSGLACGNANIVVYADNSCVNNCGTAGAPACTTADGPNCNTGGGSAKVVAGPTVSNPGSCTAGTSVTTTPTSDWTRTGRGCGTNRALTTGGCGTNQVCAARPSSSFQAKLCVYQMANLSDCSGASGYPLLHKYYTNTIDGRSCGLGTCGCSTPTNATCTLTDAQYFNSANASCASGGHALNLTAGTCNPNLGGSQVVSIQATITSSASCGMTGSAASNGSVTPDATTTITVCCAQ